jgi:hypothetical protein
MVSSSIYDRAGPGGGYSGGSGANYALTDFGNGAGSYNSGSNSYDLAAANAGHGSVVIYEGGTAPRSTNSPSLVSTPYPSYPIIYVPTSSSSSSLATIVTLVVVVLFFCICSTLCVCTTICKKSNQRGRVRDAAGNLVRQPSNRSARLPAVQLQESNYQPVWEVDPPMYSALFPTGPPAAYVAQPPPSDTPPSYSALPVAAPIIFGDVNIAHDSEDVPVVAHAARFNDFDEEKEGHVDNMHSDSDDHSGDNFGRNSSMDENSGEDHGGRIAEALESAAVNEIREDLRSPLNIGGRSEFPIEEAIVPAAADEIRGDYQSLNAVVIEPAQNQNADQVPGIPNDIHVHRQG